MVMDFDQFNPISNEEETEKLLEEYDKITSIEALEEIIPPDVKEEDYNTIYGIHPNTHELHVFLEDKKTGYKFCYPLSVI